ncbi:MAG TPA: hypothetical protein PKV96_00060 [Candidatus Saccharimonas sp.]|nr:hypothetical protein [Candidatus Saccharimonas sp.]
MAKPSDEGRVVGVVPDTRATKQPETPATTPDKRAARRAQPRVTINPTTITLAVIALLVLVSWLTGRLWPLSVLPLALVAVVIVVRSFLGRERAEATYGLPKQRVAVEASATDVAAGQTVRVKRAENPAIPATEGGLGPCLGGDVWLHKLLRVKRPLVRQLNTAELAAFQKFWDGREQEAVAAQAAAQTAQYISRLRLLANFGIRPVVSFCNIKSGGKSTVGLYVGSAVTDETRINGVIAPATLNTATSTLAIMAGIDPRTALPVGRLIKDIDSLNTYRALAPYIPITPHGLGIISEDANSVVGDAGDYNAEQFVRLIRGLYKSTGLVILDHGNDNVEYGSVPVAAVRFSDVLVFVGMAPTPVSLLTLTKTIAGHNTDHYDGTGVQDDAVALPGERISTREKVRHSIVVVTGVRPTDPPIDFEELTRPQVQDVNAPPLPRWAGKGLTVRFDPYIAREDVAPVALKRIQDDTARDFLAIAVAIFEETARVRGIAVPDDFQSPAPLVIDEY